MNSKKSKRLLLTGICRPLGEKYGDGISVGYELLHGQVTRSQGFFSPRSFQINFSLEYLAHNLEIPTVVLHYPSKKELIRELKKGYEYIGITFVLSLFHRLKEMVELIKRYSPKSKIILGGYGTVLSDEELKPYGDYICREEGVGFLRKLFGEKEKASTAHHHPMIINGLKVFSKSIGDNGMIFAGLGCPNGCDFCCTSHFFKRKHIRLLSTGRDIFELMMRYRKKNPNVKFTVIDEDFLLNKPRAMEFRDCVRAAGVDMPMFVFSSIKALSQYTIEEILEIGISGVWIGYEGRRSNYSKQEGRPVEEVIRELRAHGINVLCSMIVGFDYQTPEIIQEEFDGLMALEPTFSQFLIYGPTPGTPFYERVMSESRLREKFISKREAYYRRCTGFYSMVKHPSMKPTQIQEIQRNCFTNDFHHLGPSIIRGIENWWHGYRNLKDSANETLRGCAVRYKEDILNSLPAFWPAMLFGPTKAMRKKARALYKDIRKEFGPFGLEKKIRFWLSIPLALWTAWTIRVGWFQHPRLIRTQHRLTQLRSAS